MTTGNNTIFQLFQLQQLTNFTTVNAAT